MQHICSLLRFHTVPIRSATRLGHGAVLIGRHEVTVGLGDSGAGGVGGGERVRDGVVVGGHASGLGGGRDGDVRVGKAGEAADGLHRNVSMNEALLSARPGRTAERTSSWARSPRKTQQNRGPSALPRRAELQKNTGKGTTTGRYNISPQRTLTARSSSTRTAQTRVCIPRTLL